MKIKNASHFTTRRARQSAARQALQMHRMRLERQTPMSEPQGADVIISARIYP